MPFPILREPWCGRPNYIQMYIPSRTAIVLRPLIIEDDLMFAQPNIVDIDIQSSEEEEEEEKQEENEEKQEKKKAEKNPSTIVLLSSDS